MQVNKCDDIPKAQFENVAQFFENLDSAHPKMNVKKKNTIVDDKSERYKSYVSLGLVRNEDYSSPSWGEWVSIAEMNGSTDFTDPAKWLERYEKRKK